jgi:hypothetical protein
MNTTTSFEQNKKNILSQLAALGPMRRGTLNEQYVTAVLKDGTHHRRGPYTVYTFKQDGKTLSRRLKNPADVARYRQQIAAFRRFQELTAELAHLSQQQADWEATSQEGSKKNSRR